MNSLNFDTKQLAIHLNISINQVRKLVRNKSIPYHKIGTKLLFDKKEVEEWWENTKHN